MKIFYLLERKSLIKGMVCIWNLVFFYVWIIKFKESIRNIGMKITNFWNENHYFLERKLDNLGMKIGYLRN